MIAVESRACKVTAPPWVGNPYRLVSLREIMDALNPTDFFVLYNAAVLFKQMVRYGDNTVDDDLRRTMRESLQKDRVISERWGLHLTTMHIDRLISWSNRSDLTYAQIAAEGGDQLSQRIGDELSLLLFLRVLPERAPYYNEPVSGWEEAVKKFPLSRFDVEEAGKCFALSRYTASVLHSMRILEIGLTVLGKHYQIASDRPNWHEILVAIEKKVRALGPNDGSNWRDEQQFGSEACVQFRHFKDAWRNHAMHVRETFDDERSLTIYQHVREFMNHLATRLKE